MLFILVYCFPRFAQRHDYRWRFLDFDRMGRTTRDNQEFSKINEQCETNNRLQNEDEGENQR